MSTCIGVVGSIKSLASDVRCLYTSHMEVLIALSLIIAPPALLLVGVLLLMTRLVRLANEIFYRRFGRRFYLSVMWPGVAVHELSHAAACLLTGTRIIETKLFSPHYEGRGRLVLGYVRHVQPRGRVAKSLIGFAPFIGGSAVLYLLGWLAAPQLLVALGDFSSSGYAVVNDLCRSADCLGTLMSGHVWTPLYVRIVALVLAISVSAHIAPSGDDLHDSVPAVIFLSIGLAVTLAVVAWLYPGLAVGLAQGLAVALSFVFGLMLIGLAFVTATVLIFGVLGYVFNRHR